MAINPPPAKPSRFLTRFFPSSTQGDELSAGPIHGELMGAEHLADRAREVARGQRITTAKKGRRRTPLLGRLNETWEILDETQRRLADAVERDLDVGPAGEWLLDNFHVLQEHIREVRESLPRGYYRQLPELSAGPLAGYPRVYELAITLISHSEGRIDLDNVNPFVAAFQQTSLLSIGELWAVPAMFRLGLIENIRRMALRTVQRLGELERADQWANRIQEASEKTTRELNQVLEEFVASRPALTAVFVSRFLQRLRQSGGSMPSLVWLEQWIGEEGLNAEEAAARATQRVALTQIMMANSITSLRAIGRSDWRAFVERQSRMEAVLREDPSGFYPLMTFATRDKYRHVVERVAKRTGLDEESVARAAINLAQSRIVPGTDEREHHVGYFLVDHGLLELERGTRCHLTPGESVHRWVLRHPNLVFVGGIISATAGALAALLWLAGPVGRTEWVALLLIGFFPAAELAVSMINQLVTAFLPPHTLPKLELGEHGIPEHLRTAVVVPTLFDSSDAVRDALENLEAQFLANRGSHMHFALLGDFTDAAEETRPEDEAIVAAATEGIVALNSRYREDDEDPFFLFHRPRRWNPREGVWMGWERKRGKLAEFNQFLRGGAATAFSVIVGDATVLQQIRYVITLDADTVLPPDTAPLLIGALAHPLNRAGFDRDGKIVVRGYGILQPRVGVSLPSAHRSRFAAIHSGHPGVDPYTVAVSDVYQDLYGEGSFTGKGIYEVDTFEQATNGRFPENTLLSHDLIEGNYARAGLATDINVYDDYPTTYLTYTRRKHRWIRGDWQLLPWLGSPVPGSDGPERNRLSLLSRWKILDNMRRSTVEIAQFLFLVIAWSVLPGSPLRWTLLGLAAIAGPWIIALLLAVLRPPFDKSWRAYYSAVGRDAGTSAKQVGLAITFLPHQAWISADAILRTVWRLFVTRRNLLEWRTASQIERIAIKEGKEVWRTMWPAAVAVLGMFVFLFAGHLASVLSDGIASIHFWQIALAVFPVAVLWVGSPAIAVALSTPAERRERRLPDSSRSAALRYALLHWRYFDRFVTAESNWLAPDNYQEEPASAVAMRTSPTNIGLQLLSTVSAFDLGFLTIEDMVRRLENAFRSLERMRRHRGHFYNWYDLKDLHVLEPAYISTVDSGNFAGHLVAVRQACLAIQDQSVFDGRVWRVFEAAIELTLTRIKEYPGTDSAGSGNRPVLTSVLEMLAKARVAAEEGSTSTSPPAALLSLSTILGRISVALRGVPHHSPASPPLSEWVDWSLDLIEQHLRRLNNLVSLTVPGRNEERRVVFPALRDLPATGEPALTDRLQAIADRSFDYAWETDFRFLYDKNRKLFSIGYQQDSHSLDPSYYDLLASEARLASFLAIAKNDVPVEHWFRLGRTLTRATGQTALVSWSGSMFEYLMPTLVMQSFPYTVLDQTYRGAVARQIAYGAERGVPWGVSESAYNVRDRHLTYQYRAFGVPDLALKRGLGRDLVIAPYATALAVMIEPQRALANLAALERRGALGPYGFRDSLDYTRPDPGQRYAIVATYMAHHVAMALVALANALGGQEWQRRFHADPMVRATELLLHERIPRRILLQEVQMVRAEDALPDPELARPAVREIDNPDTAQPHVALLGLPPYTIMISHAGAGYSRYENLAVTRWRADGTRDHTGQFCYLKDLTDGRTWSAAHQPVCAPADWYRALLATDRVTFHRADGPIETRMEIAVVPADAAEVRRITVTNTSDGPREIEVTSYGEIVLAPPDSDRSHPAFSNLFVETEWHQWCTAITATRRPRATGEPVLWCAHVVAGAEQVVGPISCETDRARFLGRGRTPREPQVMESDGPLSGTTGAVLDPIFAIRARVKLGRSQSVTIAFTTLVATTRDRALELAGRYHDTHASQRALDLAWTTTQVELRELNISPAETAVFQEIAGHLFHGHPQLRAPQSELVQNRGSQPLLWSTGLSGDWPILLATISAASGLPTLRQLFAAHHYWRRRGMMVDLVIINAQPHSYQQELNDKITEALYASNDSGFADKPGGVFIRRKDLLRAEELLMLRATARVHIACDGRPLGRIVDAMLEVEETPAGVAVEPPPQLPRMPGRNPAAAAARAIWRLWSDTPREKPLDQTRALRPSRPSGASRVSDPWDVSANPLTFDNGIGGIGPDGGYQIRVQGERMPPAPWVNIIANPFGGFIVSERGSGCCWAVTSQSFRLTPWANDPVSDPPGEVIYLQDAESGELWSPTPAPFIHDAPYRVNHQAGKSTFVHEYGGIGSHLTMGLAEDETTVKIGVLRLTNRTDRPRAIIVTSYVEWTLGILREHTRHQIQTTFDVDRQAILAQNFFDPAFAESVAFSAMSEPITSWTADRRDFLGRNGAVTDPVALLHGVPLSGFSGAGVDPCAALQCVVDVAPGETREIVILLGAAATGTKAGEALDRYRAGAAAMTAAETTAANWDHRLSVITAHTPEPSFDAMVNRWTLYQALACRMWGRTALYQSSGAYGFRDQLQDSCAFVYAEQQVAREHIIRSAGRQFVEGDVQHWWHPHNGRGVRTRFSDDLIWLPFVVEQYTRVTGDTGILDAQAPYLTMRQLEPHEHEVYDIPDLSNESGSVYEHCVRALRRGATTGEHGLPLIGSGDWNDGMNRVGIEGKGESVWLAWFLIVTLRNFAELADARGEADTAGEFRKLADDYAAAVDAHAWDGEWYRRAYFDDGTPLGSAGRAECRIDSIAQSWSVISGAGTPEHQVRAMKSLDEQLVRPDARLIMLLTPAFDKTPEDPGYIKGYLPGVRENGAQYTHAALWAVLATAMQGKGDHAFDLYQMINPLTHTATPDEVARYMTEPYVVAADVYTAEGHLGRGGWTWYTGSASWMYRVGLEAILGFHKSGNTLTIKPCVPASWPEYQLKYRFGGSEYSIVVQKPATIAQHQSEVELDGRILEGDSIPLVDDGAPHTVVVRPRGGA